MTKHNLDEHLRWLLQSPLTIPAYDGPTSIAATSSSFERFSENNDRADRGRLSDSDASLIEAAHHQQKDAEKAFLRSKSIHEEGVASDDAMARLHSSSKASHKPKMLSEAVVFPTPAASSTSRTSLTDQYNARESRRPPGMFFHRRRSEGHVETDTYCL